METKSIELPAMYGDHHVIEVRRILLGLDGVEDVYASSAFRVVEVSYDPDKISLEEINARLDESGYLGELPVPVERLPAEEAEDQKAPYFRHTAIYENVQEVVSFAQSISASRRPLWPCPGIGPVSVAEQEEE